MDVLLSSQGTSQTWLIRSKPTPGNASREAHSQQPAPGWGNPEAAASLFPFPVMLLF